MPGTGPILDPDPPPDPSGAPQERPVEPDLGELAGQLDRDPGEWSTAVQGLDSLDPETRVRLIRGLAELPRGPGVAGLLRLLAGSDDPETREAAREALGKTEHLPAVPVSRGRSFDLVPVAVDDRPHLVAGLVTAVDGAGRATVGLSARLGGERVSALFRCDVGRGIVDATGVREPEGTEAGGLLIDLRSGASGLAVVEAPALAVGLLAGCLWLNGSDVPPSAAHWLDAALGTGFRPRPFLIPASAPGEKPEPEPLPEERLYRAFRILGDCPDWLDRSPLTFELAEEIVLREGRVAADPRRDAGAFRYLFEHRILGRLELYRRMLFWMARFWEAAGMDELAQSASRFAVELSDEQFAVPGHPFAQALAARSLDAAGEALGTGADPRGRGLEA